LGLDLELLTNEAAVGSFYLDVLAQEKRSLRPVAIENQLGRTDHGHLGQLLTYAAGYDAKIVVWITGDFRDEHRAALDWLNQKTEDDTQFFGVVVEAWKIDSSRPAPHFRLVAFPNDWQKRTVSTTRQGRSRIESEEGRRYADFYQPVLKALDGQMQLIGKRDVMSQQWYSFHTGVRGVRYGANFYRTDGVARVEVNIAGVNKERHKWMFDSLMERIERIETNLGEPLEWQRLDDSVNSRISIARMGRIDDGPEILEPLREWMVERLLAFKRVFGPHLAELVE